MGIAFEPVVVSAAVCGDAWWADALVSPEDAVVTGWTAPRELTVYGNEIVEFAPATGSVVRRWSVSAALDVCATATYETLSKNPDWTHVNSFDASGVFGTGHANNNEIVVSSFFFGWIFALAYDDQSITDAGVPARAAGDLLWLLGEPWAEPSTLAPWFARAVPSFVLLDEASSSTAGDGRREQRFNPGQHNVRIVAADSTGATRVGCFDNGAHNDRNLSVPSRLVEFEIVRRPDPISLLDDAAAPRGVARVAWTWGDDPAKLFGSSGNDGSNSDPTAQPNVKSP